MCACVFVFVCLCHSEEKDKGQFLATGMTRHTAAVWNALWDIPSTDSWTNNPTDTFSFTENNPIKVFKDTTKWLSCSFPWFPYHLWHLCIKCSLLLAMNVIEKHSLSFGAFRAEFNTVRHHSSGHVPVKRLQDLVKWFCTQSAQRHHWFSKWSCSAHCVLLWFCLSYEGRQSYRCYIYFDDLTILLLLLTKLIYCMFCTILRLEIEFPISAYS